MQQQVSIEDQLLRIWNKDVSLVAEEAWRCYSVGSYRACISLTWAAVAADLVEKITRLADDGDGDAGLVRKRIDDARKHGLNGGVPDMLAIEGALLSEALKLEIIDSHDKAELERLHDDRHLSSHPSLKAFGETYEPRAETARAHLAAALATSLLHPPMQGRRVVESFKSAMLEPSFSDASAAHVQSFFTRARPAGRRQIVNLCAKHALLELDVDTAPGAVTTANRMADFLRSLYVLDRQLVLREFTALMDRLQHQSDEQLVRVLGRLGDAEFLWDCADASIVSRLAAIVGTLEVDEFTSELSQDLTALFSLAGAPNVAEKLGGLRSKFDLLQPLARSSAMAHTLRPPFLRDIPKLLSDVWRWRDAEFVTQQTVIPYAHLMSSDDLQLTLLAWAKNDQCRRASMMMSELALVMFDATSHLGEGRTSAWLAFIQEVEQQEPADSAFDYRRIRSLLSTKP